MSRNKPLQVPTQEFLQKMFELEYDYYWKTTKEKPKKSFKFWMFGRLKNEIEAHNKFLEALEKYEPNYNYQAKEYPSKKERRTIRKKLRKNLSAENATSSGKAVNTSTSEEIKPKKHFVVKVKRSTLENMKKKKDENQKEETL